MIVVADTTPLNYLIAIGAIEILQPLFGKVIVPDAVARELEHTSAPAAVQTFIADAPSWILRLADPPADPDLDFLDAGERSAICLAEQLGADELLIDDLAGRREAERRQIRVTGTVGVLAEAHVGGLLDFDQAVVLLRATNFRLSPEVERIARRRIAGHWER